MNIFRKKNLFTFVSALLLVMSGAVCTSCGDDDESSYDFPSYNSSIFAGFWTVPVKWSGNSTTDLHLLMYPDGHLVYYTTDINSKKTGTWSYDPNTHWLMTDIYLSGTNVQGWTITSANSNGWIGLDPYIFNDTQKESNARKGNAEDFARLILDDLTWNNTDNSSTVLSARVHWDNGYKKLILSALTKCYTDVDGSEDKPQWCNYYEDKDTFTAIEVSNDYKTLSLVASNIKISISNPLSYNTNAMKLAIESDFFVLTYIHYLLAGGSVTAPATFGEFKGEFIVSK